MKNADMKRYKILEKKSATARISLFKEQGGSSPSDYLLRSQLRLIRDQYYGRQTY